MKIQDILSQDSIWVEKSVLPKRKMLEKISHLAAEKTGLSETVILDALIERERLGTTGIGRGVALPHSPIAGLKKIFCAFVKTAPMDFESTDGKPVEFSFTLSNGDIVEITTTANSCPKRDWLKIAKDSVQDNVN